MALSIGLSINWRNKITNTSQQNEFSQKGQHPFVLCHSYCFWGLIGYYIADFCSILDRLIPNSYLFIACSSLIRTGSPFWGIINYLFLLELTFFVCKTIYVCFSDVFESFCKFYFLQINSIMWIIGNFYIFCRVQLQSVIERLTGQWSKLYKMHKSVN